MLKYIYETEIIFILLCCSFALAFAETDNEKISKQELQNIASEAADSPSEVNSTDEYISRLENGFSEIKLIFQDLEKDVRFATVDKKENPWFDILVQIFLTILSVLSAALLGYWFAKRSDDNKTRIENHKQFLRDFNDFFVSLHKLYQEIYNYNQLVCHLGFPQYVYDFNEPHSFNANSIKGIDVEYNKFISQNIPGTVPQKESYWETIHEIYLKITAFNLLIDLAGSMNPSAQFSSLFVCKNVKKAFDSFISYTQEVSRNNFAEFNLHEYRAKAQRVLQLAKNVIDPDKTPLFYEYQNQELAKGDFVRITLFANSFTVIKVKGDKIVCKSSKGKKYVFDVVDLEKYI